MSHDRERLSGLESMRLLQTVGELMQFMQAVNWLRTLLLRLVSRSTIGGGGGCHKFVPVLGEDSTQKAPPSRGLI